MTNHNSEEKVRSRSNNILFVINLSMNSFMNCCEGIQLLVLTGKGIFKLLVIQSMEITLELI